MFLCLILGFEVKRGDFVQTGKIKAENGALALKATAEANAFAKKQDAEAQKAYMSQKVHLSIHWRQSSPT